MKEIWLNEDDVYRFLLLMSGFVISFFYDEELIIPGQAILLKTIIKAEKDEVCEQMCICVSHDGRCLVLV